MLPDFETYDHIIVSFSGGKYSLACALRLLDMGVPRDKIELWHQHVDGAPGSKPFMDWSVTESYVRACAASLEIPVRFQWREGGFKAEMLRENSQTNTCSYEDGKGNVVTLPNGRGKNSTRRKFPQTSANLSIRYCSAYLKIDAASRAINNDPRFKTARILFITGERRQESVARSKYKEFEVHRCNSKSRTVDQWRAVIDWTEEQVWAIVEKYQIDPHPAYKLGWGRVSCMTCIFGDKDQWASVRRLAPERFKEIADYEVEFGYTIHRSKSVTELADAGEPFMECDVRLYQSQALDPGYYDGRDLMAGNWLLPVGAYKDSCGGPA